MKKLNVAVLMLKGDVPPDTIEGLTNEQIAPFKTEFDVTCAIEELGHKAHILPLNVSVTQSGSTMVVFKSCGVMRYWPSSSALLML